MEVNQLSHLSAEEKSSSGLGQSENENANMCMFAGMAAAGILIYIIWVCLQAWLQQGF